MVSKAQPRFRRIGTIQSECPKHGLVTMRLFKGDYSASALRLRCPQCRYVERPPVHIRLEWVGAERLPGCD